MNVMKIPALPPLAFGLLALLSTVIGCQSTSPEKSFALFPDLIHAPSVQSEAADLFAELGGETGFLDLTRHLYRWYLDENDFKRFSPEMKRQMWIRRIQAVGDAKDKSRYLEVVFPAIGVMVTLKKTDYQISELKLNVKSDGYRIIRLSRDTSLQGGKPEDYAVLDLDIDALYARLFRMRLDTLYPCETLQAHVQARIVQQCDRLAEDQRGKPKTLYFAPVLAVDNELWVFWEEGKRLFKYSSDIDLSNPDVWTHDALTADVYDAVSQTVVSFEEHPGDNRLVTRDEVGRVLYNCIVLGKKRVAP